MLFLLTAQCMGASPVRWQGVEARPGSLASLSLTSWLEDLLRANTQPVLALLLSLSPPVRDLTLDWGWKGVLFLVGIPESAEHCTGVITESFDISLSGVTGVYTVESLVAARGY